MCRSRVLSLRKVRAVLLPVIDKAILWANTAPVTAEGLHNAICSAQIMHTSQGFSSYPVRIGGKAC